MTTTAIQGSATYSVTADWLDAPHIIQNSSKTVAWNWDHYAFGDNAPNQNPFSLGTFPYNLRFPGQYADVESGLNYNGMRDYGSTIGRYVESDPMGLQAAMPGSYSTYPYVGSNPMRWVDPYGLDFFGVPGSGQGPVSIPINPYIPGEPLPHTGPAPGACFTKCVVGQLLPKLPEIGGQSSVIDSIIELIELYGPEAVKYVGTLCLKGVDTALILNDLREATAYCSEQTWSLACTPMPQSAQSVPSGE